MIFLAVLFLAVSLRLFIWKIPYVKIAVATASLLLIATCFANVDSIVAQYNVTAYKSGTLENIDMDTLELLDRDSAVPWLLELMNDKDKEVSESAVIMLYYAQKEHFVVEDWSGELYEEKEQEKAPVLRSYNVVYARAHRLLKEHRNEIIRIYDEYDKIYFR